ncbi:MAG: lysine biosynthesis protein LysX [Candidatus Aminicenantaceae bacterium]
MKVGFLYSLIRKEEKLLLEEFNKRKNIEIIMIDDKKMTAGFDSNQIEKVDVILERCINHYRALHALKLFENAGIPCINSSKVADICGSKFSTSLALKNHKIPIPEVQIAFTEESALNAIEEMGYPVVLKPTVGSWGRLIAKISDREAAEALLEHKKTLGTYHHSIFYIQKYINKKGRDIRSFVVGDKCIAAIYRTSKHWITNTAKGGVASNCPVSKELSELSISASKAVGGGIVAVDIFEKDNGFLVNEVNYTMEFKNSISPTNTDIGKYIVDYVIAVGRRELNG